MFCLTSVLMILWLQQNWSWSRLFRPHPVHVTATCKIKWRFKVAFSLSQYIGVGFTFVVLFRALHHLWMSQPQVSPWPGLQAWICQGGFLFFFIFEIFSRLFRFSLHSSNIWVIQFTANITSFLSYRVHLSWTLVRKQFETFLKMDIFSYKNLHRI